MHNQSHGMELQGQTRQWGRVFCGLGTPDLIVTFLHLPPSLATHTGCIREAWV